LRGCALARGARMAHPTRARMGWNVAQTLGSLRRLGGCELTHCILSVPPRPFAKKMPSARTHASGGLMGAGGKGWRWTFKAALCGLASPCQPLGKPLPLPRSRQGRCQDLGKARQGVCKGLARAGCGVSCDNGPQVVGVRLARWQGQGLLLWQRLATSCSPFAAPCKEVELVRYLASKRGRSWLGLESVTLSS